MRSHGTQRKGWFYSCWCGRWYYGQGRSHPHHRRSLKNMEEADSIDRRDLLDEWYQSTAYTRLAPGGGVLFIECLTGDTPVRLPDGTDQRLDALRPGDEVATYEQGRLTTTTVAAIKESGVDKVFKITMSSGRIVRANERHPFLAAINGELKWIRTRAPTTAHKIVNRTGQWGNGKGSLVQQIAATKAKCRGPLQQALPKKQNGLTATGRQAQTQQANGTRTLNIDTGSTSPRMTV